MSIREFASMFSLPIWSVRQLIASGKLKATDKGPVVWITRTEALRWERSFPDDLPA